MTDRLLQYRLLERIGAGGMGVVWRALDTRLQREVALKLLPADKAGETARRARFLREAQAASSLNHPNIVTIYEINSDQGIDFIAMELVRGRTLHQVLQEGRLPPATAMAYGIEICEALAKAHAGGIIHRDLKPGNIMITTEGRVKVVDLGLAKLSLPEAMTVGADSTQTAPLTEAGVAVGTLAYMSPEQALGDPVDARSDIFSFGVVLYQAVSGAMPFQGTTKLETMQSLLRDEPTPVRILSPSVSESLSSVLKKCLAKRREDRYSTSTELLADLRRLEMGHDPENKAPPALRATLPGQRGWLIGAGAAVLAMAFAVSIPSVRNVISRRPAVGITPAQEKYMAILPFRAPGDNAELKYQAEGVLESLSARLFQLKNVHLASATAVESASKKDSLDKTARDLGVTLIVQGAVQGSGDRIRIALTLEDVAAKKRLWSQEFSGLRTDLLTVEDEIYSKLVAALDLKLGAEDLARGATHPTDDIGAYDLYLRARNLARSDKDEKTAKAAMDLYNQAINKDPGFALAYAGLSAACIAMYDLTKDSVWSQRAVGAAQKAERLNDNLADVHFALGGIYVMTGKTAEAISELKRGLELAPNSDDGYRRLGSAYLAVGRKDEAIQAYEKAVQVNPYYWSNYNQLGIAYSQYGGDEKAMAAFRKVAQLEPDSAAAYTNIGVVYFREGKWSECIQAFQKSLELKPSGSVYSNLGVVHLYQGNYPEAIQMFQKAVEMNPNQQVWLGNLASAYRHSGQTDKATAIYDRAISLAYKTLQVNPRSADTLSRLGLYYAIKGESKLAVEFIRRARSIDSNANDPIYKQAVIDTLAGRHPAALQALREAFGKGYSPVEAKNDPDLKALHDNPEFGRLLKEFNRKVN